MTAERVLAFTLGYDIDFQAFGKAAIFEPAVSAFMDCAADYARHNKRPEAIAKARALVPALVKVNALVPWEPASG